MSEQEERRARCRITGTVQGVAYRDWTQRAARALRLRGWVMNQTDGSVLALFIGAPQAIKEMMSACRQGPPAAAVASVSEEPEQEEDNTFIGDRFEVRY